MTCNTLHLGEDEDEEAGPEGQEQGRQGREGAQGGDHRTLEMFIYVVSTSHARTAAYIRRFKIRHGIFIFFCTILKCEPNILHINSANIFRSVDINSVNIFRSLDINSVNTFVSITTSI
jgi:hypothetical protein